ncbi:SHOCT domain-containing protein [Maridesulfovibrio sp. FT414]|uniref:SHOCT domain-containing protein n=1 Tax=Maridesulfovibrio sp. FT414 TaxID=2979469 RepID=UPI003D806791
MSSWMPFHFGGILQLVVIGLIIYFTVRMFRSPASGHETSSAYDILRNRYASGEIDEQTYRRMKDELK